MKAGFWEILLIVVLVLILFGHSKIPDLMKNLANGINVFKKEIKGDDKKNKKKENSTPLKDVKSKQTVVKKDVAKKGSIKKTLKKVAKK